MGREDTKGTSQSFAFVLAGLIFGESRLLGYSLLGVGVLLAIVDMIVKKRNQNPD
jgi:hypothetical protein